MSTFNHGPESRVRGAKNLPRNQLRVATLNVRTLTQAGSLEALKMDLAQYKLDILGVQETRLQEQEIDLGDHKLYLSDSWLSGVKSRQGRRGVAVKKSLINSIVEQVALSERICYVKFAARRRANLAVVVCYAPTNEASLQEKDLFWSQLILLMMLLSWGSQTVRCKKTYIESRPLRKPLVWRLMRPKQRIWA